MRFDFGHAALVVGVLLSSPAAPGLAMTTVGALDRGQTPSWLAITEPHQAPLPVLESALLPTQFEKVLMLDLNGRSDKSADAVIEALFARAPAGRDFSRPAPTSPAVHPERLAAFALLLILGGWVGHRLRRRRRLARSAARS